MKVYLFDQNNSGGYYLTDENVAPWMAIEALDEESAVKAMSEITEDYMDYCECCGERWSSMPYEEYDNFEEFLECYSAYSKNIRHYIVNPEPRYKRVDLQGE